MENGQEISWLAKQEWGVGKQKGIEMKGRGEFGYGKGVKGSRHIVSTVALIFIGIHWRNMDTFKWK